MTGAAVPGSPRPAPPAPSGVRSGDPHLLVVSAESCSAVPVGEGATRRSLIPPRPGSPLSLALIEISPRGAVTLGSEPEAHELVFLLDGDLTIERPGDRREVTAQAAFLHDGSDGRLRVRADDRAARLAVFTAGSGCDVHAPLGDRLPSVALDLTDPGAATGSRSFQVLLGPENGCCRATMFLGVVPPGVAPWHFHQYDEIIFTVTGAGVYHQAAGTQPTAPGSAVRIPPRTVHINENSTAGDMHVLGVFTPAGSPSAAFLADDPRPGQLPR